MTEAERAIAALDYMLGRVGETVTLQRVSTGNVVTLQASGRAVVNGFTPAELVGGIIQGDSRVILSPTPLAAAAWPLAGANAPRKGDRVLIGGQAHNVMAANIFTIGDEAARIELQVRG